MKKEEEQERGPALNTSEAGSFRHWARAVNVRQDFPAGQCPVKSYSFAAVTAYPVWGQRASV